MAQTLNLKISGLYTNPNQFSEIPEGSLQRADNIQIDKGSVAEPRRGQAKYGKVNVSYNGAIDSLYDYDGNLLVSYNNKLARDNGSGTFTDYSGTYSPPSGHRIKSTQANKNFYFTTSANIKKLDNVANTPMNAGIARALDGYFQSFAAGGFLSNSQSVAYRFVWSFRDANDNLLIGSPSGRLIVTNSSAGSNRKITLRLYIPDSITTDYFFQAYRSVIVSSTIEPPDDLQLVYEGTITNTDKTNGYVDFEDITPESLRGAFLYTSPTQEGILQSNDEPPFSVDLCTYKNMTFYANTKGRQNFFLTLISATGTAPGLVLGDTITINGITYTASASEVPASGNFLLVTSGTASSNIADTTRSLVKVINIRDPNLSAYYISGFNELPGKIWIQANDYSTSVFYLTSTRTTCWNPVLQSSGTDNASTNDENPNRIFFSKIQQPESVPILNYVDAGSRGNEILRIIPLRDSVFVLKEDGVYRIIGEDPTSLRISLFDNTVKLLSLESAVEINNQIYCYTDQGVCAVSDNGVQVLSRPIEDQTQQSEIISNFFTTSFGVSYEVDRKYLFYCKSVETDSYPTQAYVYNFFTNAWTKYLHDRSCGIVYNERLYMGGVDGWIYRERKALNSSDYVDDAFSITINSINGNVLTLASATNIAVNQVIRKGAVSSVVTAVNGNDVTVESGVGFTTGSANSYEPIESIIEWSQNDSQNPGILKHWREITMLFRTADFSSIEIGFSSNFDSNIEYVEVSPLRSDQWGLFPWGSIPWGIGTGLAYPIRTYIPLLKRRASWVFFRVRSKKAQSYFAIQGLSAMFEPMSERFK